jgi:hypothetical protein
MIQSWKEKPVQGVDETPGGRSHDIRRWYESKGRKYTCYKGCVQAIRGVACKQLKGSKVPSGKEGGVPDSAQRGKTCKRASSEKRYLVEMAQR